MQNIVKKKSFYCFLCSKHKSLRSLLLYNTYFEEIYSIREGNFVYFKFDQFHSDPENNKLHTKIKLHNIF